MEIDIKEKEIEIREKELTALDYFILDFVENLEGLIDYVIVGGYVPVLFGRCRGTEDIDILIQDISEEKFKKFLKRIKGKYELLIPDDMEKAFRDLKQGNPIRFCRKGIIVPNAELRIAKTDYQKYSLKNALKIKFGGKTIKVSPIEMQIAYKLFTNDRHDQMDARFLFKLLRRYINIEVLRKLIEDLKIDRQVTKEVLGEDIWKE